MATWIAHLRIAENLLARIPGLNPGQFAIGSVAPDSGIPDENWEKFDPPPAVTHFMRNPGVHKDIADLDFYRGYLANLLASDAGRFSFRLGYFFHLVADNLWTVQVGRPTSERFAEQFAADPKFIWEVKEDWYGLDQVYVRAHPDCLFWRVFLDAQPFDGAQGKPASADLDFLPPQALPRQLHHIKAFYQRDDDEIKAMMARPMAYLPRSEMDRFVADATEQIYSIYTILWPAPPNLDTQATSLELLASE